MLGLVELNIFETQSFKVSQHNLQKTHNILSELNQTLKVKAYECCTLTPAMLFFVTQNIGKYFMISRNGLGSWYHSKTGQNVWFLDGGPHSKSGWLKCPDFECFRYSNVRFSDPHCIWIVKSCLIADGIFCYLDAIWILKLI